MLDLTHAPRKRLLRVPVRLKLLFLCLPWAFVAYGLGILTDHVAFYRNSVAVEATVVDLAPSRKPVPPLSEARTPRHAPTPWYQPRYMYTHENGATYVGAPLSALPFGAADPGDIVRIRYQRGQPELAHPDGILHLWYEPARFIAAGVFLYLLLLSAFRIVEGAADDRRATWVRDRRPLVLSEGRLKFTA